MSAVGGVEVIDLGFVAAEALTKFRFVVPTLGQPRTVDMADSAGEAVLGVVQHNVETADAAEGAHANVRIMGISVVEAGAAVAVNDPVTIDTSGRAVAVAATVGLKEQAGIALMAAGGAGDLIPVLLTPRATRNTATT